jgi:hypothetical protein
MIGKNVHYTFEEVIKEADRLEPGDLAEWMKLICKYYFTDRDLMILEALKVKQEGKHKQRELSILFCIAQPHLSDSFKSIRVKILTLYNFLQSEAMLCEYMSCRPDLTDRQFSLLQLAMAGNSFYDIARVEKVSNPDVSITFRLMVTRLEKTGKYPTMVKFLHKYKGKFIKN